MLFLRPKTEVTPPADPAPNVQTSAPAVSQPGKVAEAAQGAVAAADGQLQSQESVDGVDAGESAAGTSTTTKTADSAAAAAAAATSRRSRGPAEAGRQGDPQAPGPRPALLERQVGRRQGRSRRAEEGRPLGRPRVGPDRADPQDFAVRAHRPRRRRRAVADRRGRRPELRADTLVGYVDTTTIDQSVVDALRNSTGLFTDAYLKSVDKVCVQNSNRMNAIPNYYPRGNVKKLDTRLTTYDRAYQDFIAGFGSVKAPKKWKAFKSAAAKDLAPASSWSRSTRPRSSRRPASPTPSRPRGRSDRDRADQQAAQQEVRRPGPVPLRLGLLDRRT